VALTRAIRNVYLIESDTQHPLFELLEVKADGPVKVEARQASLEDWQKEARKLELQGKQEQADAIRNQILKQTPPPWTVQDQQHTEQLLTKVFRDNAPGSKHRQPLYEQAVCYDLPVLADFLQEHGKFQAANTFYTQRSLLVRKNYMAYFSPNFKDILRQCDKHGVEHRLPVNLTPLMAATAAGNLPLVDALLERGASLDAQDTFGCTALHWAMQEAFRDPKYAKGPFAALYERLAPAWVDVNTGERLVRIDRHLTEYFVFQTLWALFRSRFTHFQRRPYAAFDSQTLIDAWEALPANVVRPERKKRQHLNHVLSRNEIMRDYAYNRALFQRVRQGWYQFNPQLLVRDKTADGAWMPIYTALNLPFTAQFSDFPVWNMIDMYLAAADLPPRAELILPWKSTSTLRYGWE
jgi:hypothetical protein